MTEQLLLLTRGLPGSGKTTFAREWVEAGPLRARVNRDDLRFAMFGRYVLDREGEELTTQAQHAMVRALLRGGNDVIVDDTNLNARFVKEFLKIAREVGAQVNFVDFAESVDVCIERVAKRVDDGGRHVPSDVIRNMAARYMPRGKLPPVPVLDGPLEERRVYNPDVALPKAYLFDIDGTLARMSNRSPFDWHRVGEDSPIEDVVRLSQALFDAGYYVVFMSGRDRVCYDETKDWLWRHVANTLTRDEIELYMRTAGDMRKDSIVKHELFYKYVADKYHVVGVVDDRQQVVDMWREIGLTCFQAAPGDF